jgi:hypothetical protein
LAPCLMLRSGTAERFWRIVTTRHVSRGQAREVREMHCGAGKISWRSDRRSKRQRRSSPRTACSPLARYATVDSPAERSGLQLGARAVNPPAERSGLQFGVAQTGPDSTAQKPKAAAPSTTDATSISDTLR